MYTQALITTALLAATSVTAQRPEQIEPEDQTDQAVSPPYLNFRIQSDSIQLSKLDSDASSLVLKNTVAANALYSWAATQTSVPDDDIDEQNSDYFNAFLTATGTALPAYITALPESIRPYASSLLIDEASLIRADVAPLLSSVVATASAARHAGASGTMTQVNSAKSTGTAGKVAPVPTSGMPSNSVNATNGASPGPTPASNPPVPDDASGAAKNSAFVAAGLLALGLAGIMSVL